MFALYFEIVLPEAVMKFNFFVVYFLPGFVRCWFSRLIRRTIRCTCRHRFRYFKYFTIIVLCFLLCVIFIHTCICVLLGVLKQYLRELPEPLLTFELHHSWIEAARLQLNYLVTSTLSQFLCSEQKFYLCARCSLEDFSQVLLNLQFPMQNTLFRLYERWIAWIVIFFN